MRCSCCGQVVNKVHDVCERWIRDLPILDAQTHLLVSRRRVLCPRCGPKLEALSWLDAYARVTRRLDIGTGQGRNALPLARRGLHVVGIDPSRVGVATVREKAAQEELSIEAIQVDFRDYRPDAPFNAVLCFGLLQILSQRDGASLIERLTQWVRPGGVLFLTAWHVEDPDFAELCEKWQRLGRRGFYSPEGDYRLFLWPGEILQIFSGWRVVHHWEGLGQPHRHGDGPEERHGEVEVVLVNEDGS